MGTESEDRSLYEDMARMNNELATLQREAARSNIERQRDQEALRRLNAELEDRVRARTLDLEASRDEAERADRVKSDFIATMSHELRTPMNGVIGVIELLQRSGLTSEQAELLGLASASAGSLLGVIEGILDFSKLETGTLDLECKPVSVAAVVAEALCLVAATARSKSVTLVSEVAAGTPEAIFGDALRLRQVLVHMLSNAIKFSSPDEGAPHVSLRVMARWQQPHRPVLCLEIEDNGIGMDSKTLAALFLPFSQADSSTTRRFGGTGLGLAISQRFIDLMGGQILVSSTPGTGSVFTIRLPFDPAPGLARELPMPAPRQSAGPASAPRLAPRRTERVLVAEDNVINRKVIASQLRVLGFPFEIAADGVEALALWRSGRFAVLLTDLQMPRMDGYGLTASIREEEAGRAGIPIIALTANALKAEESRCLDAGMDQYLTKPAQIATLGAALDRAVNAADRGAASVSSISRPPDAAIGPVDPGILPELVGDDPATLREFMTEFAVLARQVEDQLIVAVSQERCADCVAIAHKLKSSARAVGAMNFGERCAAIEAAARLADVAKVRAMLAGFGAEAGRVLGWIQARYGEGNAA